MLYNYDNQEKINKLSMHDDYFSGFEYDYDARQINIECKNNDWHQKHFLHFNNVIYCNIQSCLFWGAENYVYDIYLNDDEKYMKELMKLFASNPMNQNYINDGIKFIQIEIKLCSGDTFLFICESLEFEEEELQ